MQTHVRIRRQCGRALLASVTIHVAACGDDPTDVGRHAGPPARIRLVAPVDLAPPGSSLDTVFVTVSDEANNPVGSEPIAWLVESGGGTIRALAGRTDARGIARAIWTLGPQAGDNVLAASAAGLTARGSVVASIGFPAKVVVIGGTHGCALTPLGVSYCWGANMMGQLGIGTISESPEPRPVRVNGGLTFTSLVAGVFHTCGLTTGNEAYCWGGNLYGAVGVSGQFITTPTRVAGSYRFSALAAGAHHTCGLTTAGAIVCWGDDRAGALGVGTDRSTASGPIQRPTPARIAGDLVFVALAASYHATCAIATTGQSYCWGGNAERELGTNADVCRMPADPYYYPDEWDWPCSTRPVPIDSDVRLTSIVGSTFLFCGLTHDQRLLCWGESFRAPVLAPVGRLSRAWSLGHDVCGLDDVAGVRCWEVLNGFRPTSPFGDAIALADFSTVGNASCGLSRDSPAVAYCWGTNEFGQLGDGTTLYRPAPAPVALPRTPR